MVYDLSDGVHVGEFDEACFGEEKCMNELW
jgi:hypothetical protein